MAATEPTGPASFFTADHRACDALWGEVEAAIEGGDRARAEQCWRNFDESMRRHFSREEEVLFPAILEGMGMSEEMGPVAVMKAEHKQMRAVLDQMARAADAKDYENLLDQGDTLLMLIQQHNVKEEGILYPMADRAVGAQWPQLREQLKP